MIRRVLQVLLAVALTSGGAVILGSTAAQAASYACAHSKNITVNNSDGVSHVTMTAQWQCSDGKFHHFGAMPFLFWRLIEESKAEGMQKIDFGRTDLDTVSLTYKMNSWVSFVNETSYIVTHADKPDALKFRGVFANQAHDWRQEFGPIFTF